MDLFSTTANNNVHFFCKKSLSKDQLNLVIWDFKLDPSNF